MFNWIKNLFKVKEFKKPNYTNEEEFFLLRKGFTKQDIEDYFFEITYVKNSIIPYRCSYFITSRLSLNYTPDTGYLDIYFDGNIYPYKGSITIDTYKFCISEFQNRLLKGQLLSLCSNVLPNNKFEKYIERINQVGSDLAEFRMRKTSQKYRTKYFS